MSFLLLAHPTLYTNEHSWSVNFYQAHEQRVDSFFLHLSITHLNNSTINMHH